MACRHAGAPQWLFVLKKKSARRLQCTPSPQNETKKRSARFSVDASLVLKSLKNQTGQLFSNNVALVYGGEAEVLGRFPGGLVIRNLLHMQLNGGVVVISRPQTQRAAIRKPENHARCTGAPDDSKVISLSISWNRVQSNRSVRCGLPWADGRDFRRARFANHVLNGELPRRRYDDVKI